MTTKNKQGVREYKAAVGMKSSAINPSNTLVYNLKILFSYSVPDHELNKKKN